MRILVLLALLIPVPMQAQTARAALSASPATPMRCVVPLDCSHSSSSAGRDAWNAWTSCSPHRSEEIRMPIVEIRKDPKLLTMTVIAQFAAPVARVWAAYADPRQVERFWGPPEWPAKFEWHDFTVGGRSEYVMTGPNGEQSRLLGVPEHRRAAGVRGDRRLPRA